MKRWTVTVERLIQSEDDFEVEAETEDQAKRLAVEQAEREYWDDDPDYTALFVELLGGDPTPAEQMQAAEEAGQLTIGAGVAA